MQVAQREGKITSRVYQKLNATTRDVARRDLEKLVAQGKLRRIGRGKATCYAPVKYASNMRHENARIHVTQK